MKMPFRTCDVTTEIGATDGFDDRLFALFSMEEEQVKLAVVKQIIGRTGSRGGVTQVKVEFMDNSGRSLIRNVKGAVRLNDILSLLETEREARRLR